MNLFDHGFDYGFVPATPHVAPSEAVAPPPRPLPLFINLSHPDHTRICVKLDGKIQNDFIEVDVLGCAGVRFARGGDGHVMMDDDGCARHEKLYGNFTLEWIEEEINYSFGVPFAAVATRAAGGC